MPPLFPDRSSTPFSILRRQVGYDDGDPSSDGLPKSVAVIIIVVVIVVAVALLGYLCVAAIVSNNRKTKRAQRGPLPLYKPDDGSQGGAGLGITGTGTNSNPPPYSSRPQHHHHHGQDQDAATMQANNIAMQNVMLNQMSNQTSMPTR